MNIIPKLLIHRFNVAWLLACALMGGFVAASPLQADSVFSSDFSKGSFDSLGWTFKDGGWEIYDYKNDHPTVTDGPGMIARYGKSQTTSWLIKKIPSVSNPSSLVLTFDAGYGWGSANQGSDSLAIMLLDDDGNGYIISLHRTKAKWAAQWGAVASYVFPKTLNWASDTIDGTQKAIVDGGNLQTFTVKRGANGTWTVSGAAWGGVTLDFQDSTTSAFTQVVLVGSNNFDDILFNKVSLDVTP